MSVLVSKKEKFLNFINAIHKALKHILEIQIKKIIWKTILKFIFMMPKNI